MHPTQVHILGHSLQKSMGMAFMLAVTRSNASKLVLSQKEMGAKIVKICCSWVVIRWREKEDTQTKSQEDALDAPLLSIALGRHIMKCDGDCSLRVLALRFCWTSQRGSDRKLR